MTRYGSRLTIAFPIHTYQAGLGVVGVPARAGIRGFRLGGVAITGRWSEDEGCEEADGVNLGLYGAGCQLWHRETMGRDAQEDQGDVVALVPSYKSSS